MDNIEKTKKISYAPSCEDLNPNYRLNEQCIESLKQFKSILKDSDLSLDDLKYISFDDVDRYYSDN